MNLSEYATKMTSTWIERFTEKLGSEDKFTTYVDNVYKLLDDLKVDESIRVVDWAKPETIELFIKVAICYIQSSKCCYQFNREYTIIKRQFDAQEVDKQLALLAGKRKAKIAGADGSGTTSGEEGIKTVPAPEPTI